MPVDFPFKLDMTGYVLDKEVHDDESLGKYELYAVSNHIGESDEMGHYTAYAKNCASGGKWFLFDDAETSPVDDVSAIVSKDAFVLYYARV